MSKQIRHAVLDGFVPFPEARYADLALASLAAYAMARLDEQNVPLTIENITVALFKLFPARFAMVGFPQYPDGTRANRTLLQMQPQYRNYATGSAKHGYSLTALGRKAAEDATAILDAGTRVDGGELRAEATYAAERGHGPARTVHDEDVIAEVRHSLLFEAYERGQIGQAVGVDFLGLLGVFSHTPKTVVRRELARLEEAAERQRDDAVSQFLRECRKRFAAYLRV